MSIKTKAELDGMKRISDVVALTLNEMKSAIRVGMTAKELDDFGADILRKYGARPGPSLMYNFPGATCISTNHEVAHGIPYATKVFREGDLVNIDVSAELDGFWSDNGASFVLGTDHNRLQPLVDAGSSILKKALSVAKAGTRIREVGKVIEQEAKRYGYTIIRNLTGHGVGRSLHEAPDEIPNFNDITNHGVFRLNSVVAIETFISTTSTMATTLRDGWTLVGNRGGYVVQHEHTVVITEGAPIILTHRNGI